MPRKRNNQSSQKENSEERSTSNSANDPVDLPPPEVMPLLPIEDMIIFPGMVSPILVSDEPLIQMVNEVLASKKLMALVTKRRISVSLLPPPPLLPGFDDVYSVGCIVQILKLIRMPDNTIRILVQGVDRIVIQEIEREKPYWRARIQVIKPTTSDVEKAEALRKRILEEMGILFKLTESFPEEFKVLIHNVESAGGLADLITANLQITIQQKQYILEASEIVERLTRLLGIISKEIEVLKLANLLQSQVDSEINRSQREYLLREQLRAIQRELGEYEGKEIDDLREQIEKKDLPPHVKEAAMKELERLSRMNPSSAEYSVSRTYLDWLLEIPWNISSDDQIEISNAKTILEEDHFGLEDVKERILEFLAVRKLKSTSKGPILCLVGPPGVGKTSVGKSIARAMGRTFFRFSLGGMRDEAEIRGHRRTYVGALPGRIVQGIKKAGTNNPVFMLDEIDKLGQDFRGDPASALLEVLDPEQNSHFTDHYLEVEMDLSKVLFITTSNTLETIPRPLLDRMEVIRLPGYLTMEKIQIGLRYLVPRQLEENGLSPLDIHFTPQAIDRIITEYTHEAGVRNLERKIGAICRKVAVKKASDKLTSLVKIHRKAVQEYLGVPVYFDVAKREQSEVGVANGLAWTPFGGDVLKIEVATMPGTKGLFLTGQLGPVMKESAEIALSIIRSRYEQFGLDKNFLKGLDIHVHVPEGATPKDGPSAGITIATALVSKFTHRKVRGDIAMTGEITLQGKVLPIGGLREKSVAAVRAGIKTVIIPKQNQKDLSELPKQVVNHLTFVPVEHFEEVLEVALEKNGINELSNTNVKKKAVAKVIDEHPEKEP
ncbi:MAG: endopeptidase La [bacterium]|nr:endopeptidase La [bacterium]